MADSQTVSAANGPRLRRTLSLWDLILYGMIVIQPTAPMPVYGVMSQRAHGHAVTTVLIAMVAMLFTAISYGRMARAYPSAGSAFTYVGAEIHPALGYVTGWGMAMDYMLNPIVCTILCSKFALNFFPEIPYPVFVILFIYIVCRPQSFRDSHLRPDQRHSGGGHGSCHRHLPGRCRSLRTKNSPRRDGFLHASFLRSANVFSRCRAGWDVPGGFDLHRLRWNLHIVGGGRESQTQHPSGNRSGLLDHRRPSLGRGVCCPVGLARCPTLSGCGHCLCACCRPGRRSLAIQPDQCHAPGGNGGFRYGIAARSGTASLRDGPE